MSGGALRLLSLSHMFLCIMTESLCRYLIGGEINFSGKNLNIGVYDNGLKSEGQDARSN